jgi:hypothetical protein
MEQSIMSNLTKQSELCTTAADSQSKESVSAAHAKIDRSKTYSNQTISCQRNTCLTFHAGDTISTSEEDIHQASIDVSSSLGPWFSRIEMYGATKEEAEELRDILLAKLAS